MFGLALCRHLISKRPTWRCHQQMTQPWYSTTNAQLVSKVDSMLIPPKVASINRLLCIRPATWAGSRLCHSDTRDTKGFSLRTIRQAPKPAMYLGFAGLIPFVAAPLAMVTTQCFYPEVAYAQLMYGASIVSFLGGARWGFAIPDGSPARPDWMNLGNSVVPSLLAWLALLCGDNVVEGVLVVLMGLGLSLHYDLTLLPGYPAWFNAMRTVLTLVATFSLVATLMLKKFCAEKKLKASS
nr:transmembrane protein 69-like isoform X2 [Doryrhamphus excisus]XP_057924663.1 transmembrane protein 69-like isoform X2 [Doryrhamphus excisus]XP_057924664.1 transmembrane protein 69-like isoform X2 [Doryrhamphus excisus]XP_057924666.1 transmembrane protein 69-like isoform X2 [Doryrhamphus excisus]XP_057924667.1 transmembrane protein 69-like isoform X2 [Doryrhamphus excisus]XP_057924668.1 transmembrane protein 69-like isoform X2 [Doryrhamphus excisus]